MRMLYLIFSHDHQEQIARLVRAIRNLSPNSLVAIHHDPTKSSLDIELFADTNNVHIIPNPVRGEWGDYSLVEQYLHAMRWCMTSLDFDWSCTITGLTYPIKPLLAFEASLEETVYDAFVYHFDAFDPDHWPKGTAETRYLFTYYKLPRFPYYYKIPSKIRAVLSKTRTILNRMQSLFRIMPMPRGAKTRFGIRRLRTPIGNKFKLYGGRQMLNLNWYALERLFRFIDENPSWVTFSKRTLIPDELFFNSIIANDSELRVCNDVLRYIKWPKLHAASVSVITHDELSDALKSKAPFGLKFDSRVDPLAIDQVDALLGLSIDSPSTRDS